MDEALPSGNGIMAFALNRLGHLSANINYLNIAEKTIQCAWLHIESAPVAHHSLLHALEEILQAPELLIIVYKNGADLTAWKHRVIEDYTTHRLCFFLSEAESLQHKAFNKYKLLNNEVTAYSCKNHQCSEPITNPEGLP